MKEKMKIGNLIIEEDELGTTMYEDYAYGSIVDTNQLRPTKVIFNDPATIVFWNDGSKTVVKCSEHDTYDKYRGFTMAYLKRVMGSGKKAEQFIEGNGFEESGVSFIQELLDLMAKGKGI